MKDAKNHLKQLQKKVMNSTKKENSSMTETTKFSEPPPFKRPKIIPKKRKIA